MLTGLNDAFIISGEKRNEILNNCISQEERKRTEGLIRPILRGRDIKRYGYNWANLWLIATFPSKKYDIELFPAVKNYLLSFAYGYLIVNDNKWVASYYLSEFCQKKLEQKGREIIINGKYIFDINGKKEKSRKKTNNKWFETQDSISYWEDFAKPKIIFQEIVQESQFFFDNKGTFFCNDTGRIIVGNNLYFLLGILNSSLFFYSIKHFYGGGVLGENGIRMKHTFFQSFPCAKINKSITQLTVSLLVKYDKSLFDFLDKKIMKIYNLTDEEIQEVLNN